MAFFVRASKGNGVDTASTFSGALGPQPDVIGPALDIEEHAETAVFDALTRLYVTDLPPATRHAPRSHQTPKIFSRHTQSKLRKSLMAKIPQTRRR